MPDLYFKTEEEYDAFADMMVDKAKKEFFESLYKVHNNPSDFISYVLQHPSLELTEEECREAFIKLSTQNNKQEESTDD